MSGTIKSEKVQATRKSDLKRENDASPDDMVFETEQEQEINESKCKPKGPYLYCMFGKVIVRNGMEPISNYSMYRHWFNHGIPEAQMVEMINNNQHTVPSDINIFSTESQPGVPAPCTVSIPRYPTPFPPFPTMIRNGSSHVSNEVVSNREALLEHHTTRWKKIRQSWVLCRKLYLQRYEPSMRYLDELLSKPK